MNDGSSDDVVLCVNRGSSSLKFTLFRAHGVELEALATGALEGLGTPHTRAWLRISNEEKKRSPAAFEKSDPLSSALRLLGDAGMPPPTRIGHRVVHGGRHYVRPTKIDAKVLDDLTTLIPLAPLHMPASIEAIRAVAAFYPTLPQVACFDTAFHASMPEVAWRFPLPDRYVRAGLRRYGFHGLSYEYVMSTLGPTPPERVVIAHLGNGASLVAVRDGRSVDTTMGFTPAGGIMMGTRSGDMDPGALVHLLRHDRLSADALEHVVESESGLLAVGGTSDMRALLEASASDPAAKLAVSMFGYQLRKAIGGLVASLGGVDRIVFTGGIGEHAAPIREAACEGLAFMGVELDSARNGAHAPVISAASSRCVVSIVPSDEELVIARHTRDVLRGT